MGIRFAYAAERLLFVRRPLQQALAPDKCAGACGRGDSTLAGNVVRIACVARSRRIGEAMKAAAAEQALDAYFREGASWDNDRVAAAHRSARVAWRVAGAGWVCAVTGGASLLLLMPLKRVEPFVIRVDNTSGIVDVVPVYAGEASVDQAVTRYFVTHYITICERFNFATAESDYEECGAFHAAQRNQAWSALWNKNNPASPLNVHKDGSTMRAQVESVSFFRRGNGIADLAQVRYVKAERQGSGAPERFTHWIATLQYAYTAVSKDPLVRRWNPLGFKIVDLVSEPEVPAATPAETQ
jgi:type IV secretion system protein VirB8